MVVIGEGGVQGHIPTVDAVMGRGWIQGHIPTVDVMGKGVKGHHCGCYWGGREYSGCGFFGGGGYRGIFPLWVLLEWIGKYGDIFPVLVLTVIGWGYKSITMNVTGGEGGTWHIPTVNVMGRGVQGHHCGCYFGGRAYSRCGFFGGGYLGIFPL